MAKRPSAAMSEEKRLPSAGYFRGLKKIEIELKVRHANKTLSFIFIFLSAAEEDLFSSRNIGQFV